MEGKTTMNEDSPMIFVIAVTIALFVGGVFGWCLSSDSWRQELVNRGFAQWQIVEGTREVEFKWKEKQ